MQALLEAAGGPFFAGASFSAADVAWAPFLERCAAPLSWYAAQLPCLHKGLVPRDPSRWPCLAAWCDAMGPYPSPSPNPDPNPSPNPSPNPEPNPSPQP
eukprot:scaffold76899_cov84-Phaeocystis_antarctica.AAC.1